MTLHRLSFDPKEWTKRGRPDPRLQAADVETLQTALFDAARLLRTSVALLRHKLTPRERELVLESLLDRANAIDLSAFHEDVRHAVVGEVEDCGITLMAGYFDDDGAA